MKIIDLLNKIANGEEVPNKIIYKDKLYIYETFNIGYGKDYFNAEWKIEKGYRHRTMNNSYIYLNIHDYCLNDEVEIIEEEPRNIEVCGSLFTKSEYDKLAEKEDKGISKDIKWYLVDFQEEEKTKIAEINMNFKILREKLVEIIDRINEEE